MDSARPSKHRFSKITATTLVGIAVGFWAASALVKSPFPFGAVAVGPWRAWPGASGPDIDPYALAVLARTAQMPLGVAEGLRFEARTDSRGQALIPQCDYRVSGSFGEANYWSLALHTPDGSPIFAGDSRGALTSTEVLRYGPGLVSVIVAPNARAGNWLASDSKKRFVLTLTLYDLALGTSFARLDQAKLPTIERLACI